MGGDRKWKTCTKAHLSTVLEVTPHCILPTVKQIMHPFGFFIHSNNSVTLSSGRQTYTMIGVHPTVTGKIHQKKGK